MSEKFRLAGTEITVRIDWDLMHVSFGADTDELHCWTCAEPFTAAGAFRSRKDLPDARMNWEDAERYNFPAANATSCLICWFCVATFDPHAKLYGRPAALAPAALPPAALPPAAKAPSQPTGQQLFDQMMAIDEQNALLEIEIANQIARRDAASADAARDQIRTNRARRDVLAAAWNALQNA